MEYFSVKVLSDDGKRKQYDAWGTTSDQMNREGGGPTGSSTSDMGADAWGQSWKFHSQVDPEEFFRKIFGDGAFRESDFDNFAESRSGHAAAKEVSDSQIIR